MEEFPRSHRIPHYLPNVVNQSEGKVKLMWWKRLRFYSLIGLLAWSLAMLGTAFAPSAVARAEGAEVGWNKYVTEDGSFSFHYPRGWVVGETESGIVIHDVDTYEQLWLVLLPYQGHWTAAEHADFFLGLVQEENPDMQAYGWELVGDDAVFFGLVQGSEQRRADGMGIVLKNSAFEQALWFHYLAPADLFAEERGYLILEGFVNSLTSGVGSLPPEGSAEARAVRLDRNADGFLFVLEFALGSPLSLAEETLILKELTGIWREYSEAELAAYDEYPLFAEFIMSMSDQGELAEVQESVGASIWEWIEESDPGDPIVSVIRAAFLEGDQVLVQGAIPLTEVAATAYAELLAFAEFLAQNGGEDAASSAALPSMIGDGAVREIKEQLMDAWPSFSQEEQQQVEALPAVWTTLRRALGSADEADSRYARSVILQLAPTPGESSDADSTQDGSYDPMAWARHQTMLQIQQQTFNHYMWSVGYHSTLLGF
jgi:hypothetical protein